VCRRECCIVMSSKCILPATSLGKIRAAQREPGAHLLRIATDNRAWHNRSAEVSRHSSDADLNEVAFGHGHCGVLSSGRVSAHCSVTALSQRAIKASASASLQRESIVAP
jgi:hypothetical protein